MLAVNRRLLLFLEENVVQNTADMIQDTEPRIPRYKLKAKVIESGYSTFLEFAEQVGVHRVHLSMILNGHLFPSAHMQQRLAEELGLTIKELRELL